MEILSPYITKSSKPQKYLPESMHAIFRHKSQPHVRVKDSILYLAPTNQNFKTFGYNYKTNGMGFRERSFNLKKKPKTFRILVFGDSLTFGVAVATEQRYTNQLEIFLNINNQKNPTKNLRTEILNFGVPGYALDQERDLMSAILNLVECDLVIVGIIDDDLNITTQTSLQKFTINQARDAVSIPLYKNQERTYQTIYETEPYTFSKPTLWIEKFFLFKLLDSRTGLFAYRGLPSQDRWNYALNEFLNMKALTKQFNLPSPVIALLNYGSVNPNDNDFYNTKGKLAKNIEILNFVENELTPQGFHVANTLPIFKQYNHMTLAVSEWESHPNYLGHYIYAQTLLKFLLKKKLVQ